MSPAFREFLTLAPLGFAVGVYGTIIGSGGGSLLVPLLLILLPDETPATVTSMSLMVVFFTAYSGSVSYMRSGRIDYRAAALFFLAGVPGAVLGPALTHQVPRQHFAAAFGVLLLVGGIWLAVVADRPAELARRVPRKRPARGAGHFNPLLGAIGVSYICMIATLFGLGGGVLYVPFLIRGLGFPPHVATATSQFFLAGLTLVAIITHLALGAFNHGLDRTMYLAVGVMMGAPVGAAIASRIRARSIVRLLALAVVVVGLRLLFGGVLRGAT